MAIEDDPKDKALKDNAGQGSEGDKPKELKSEPVILEVSGKPKGTSGGEKSLNSTLTSDEKLNSLEQSKASLKSTPSKSTRPKGNSGKKKTDALAAPSPKSSSKASAEKDNTSNASAPKVSNDKTSTAKDKPVKSPPPKNPSSKTTSKRGGGIFKLLIILLLLIALIAAGYWIYLQRNQGGELLQLVNNQQQSVAALEEALHEEQMQRVRQSAILEEATNELKLRVNSQSNRLRELSTTTRSDWLLAEAEYLMRLANQRLVTERNTKNPVALLNSADQILRDLDAVDLFAVRKSLAADIMALQMATNVDREGLFLQLNALSDQLVKLPLFERDLRGEPKVLPTMAVNEGEQNWQGRMLSSVQRLVSQLSDFVRVKHRGAPVEPLLSPDEEIFVRHNLRILLEQAQLSLLREEQSIYQASLAKAGVWVRQYFQLNDNANILVQQLDNLVELQVVQELPDISSSLEALREYIDNWHKKQTISENSIDANSKGEVEQ